MIVRLVSLILFVLAAPALAQQTVRLDVSAAGHSTTATGQLYRPAGQQPAPAVAILHGCGGVGQNNARMAGLLKDWGYVALVVDSFSTRGIKDACGRNWPTQADAEKRAHDIDAAVKWLGSQSFVDPSRIAFMGYSYGGGVAMLRAFTSRLEPEPPPARAAILVYPDCALADPLGPKLRARLPVMFAMAALDDWTPVATCQAVIGRVAVGRDLIETHMYEGAHHSFDALGLPVRYLPGAGNRSKPGGCCGAHYGAHEPSWKAFVADVRAFLARQFAGAR